MRSLFAAFARSSHPKRWLGAAVALLGVAGIIANPAGSRADLDSVRPSQGFQGEVNGSSVSGAVVYVVSNPLGPACKVSPGQTVDIFTDATLGGPRTGATDTYVDEYFDSFPSEKIHITKYGQQFAQQIPTSFDAPCTGQAHAIFQPGSGSGGVNDSVNVFFVKQGS